MRKPVVLITGAGGEIGHGLIEQLVGSGRSLDRHDGSEPAGSDIWRKLVQREFTGSITDARLLDRILSEFEIDTVYHLAALLSTRSEFTPVTAHQVNVEGHAQPARVRAARGRIARPARAVSVSVVHRRVRLAGSRDQSAAPARVREDDYNTPTTMYGCNKLYCEQLGRYYARFYKQLAAESQSGRVDFRSVRFPGLDLGDDRAVGRNLRLRA